MLSYLKERNILKLNNEIKPIYLNNKVFFHSYSHILDGLIKIEKLPKNIKINDSQLIAWLFHDIVYDVKSSDNEENSAQYFKKFYTENKPLFNGLNIVEQDVCDIIRDTKEHKPKRSPLSSIILDIDLSCLSDDYETFKKGRINVIKEYRQIYSKDEIVSGTLAFLEGFIDEKIFITDYFSINFEQRAQNNIKQFYEEVKSNYILKYID